MSKPGGSDRPEDWQDLRSLRRKLDSAKGAIDRWLRADADVLRELKDEIEGAWEGRFPRGIDSLHLRILLALTDMRLIFRDITTVTDELEEELGAELDRRASQMEEGTQCDDVEAWLRRQLEGLVDGGKS